MVNCRPGTFLDLISMQNCNLTNLPENYSMRFYLYHYLVNPEMIQIAELPHSHKVIGYVMSRMQERNNIQKEPPYGGITSVSILRTYRKMGIAHRLMRCAHRAMGEIYGAEYVSLHVRETNTAAKHLYLKTMGYHLHEPHIEYYADGETAYELHCSTKRELFEHVSRKYRAKDGNQQTGEPGGGEGKSKKRRKKK
ncbi:putative N-terminal acetyltransferase A complex catalytic subunit NAA10 [Blattamonas nauphoetae]|uniref:N-terminal acetyltransferase A complex catalytic subunit NAA10 n=1 Tax=Blattamonas nauphoetae TaxID=2049346 RepID=A0ABQ9X789_9EUKA|nr:putative N-terminal acetyltransferase A complex catalytic subunit NAA10 [Blattamonas nauphoetae]